MFGNSAKDGLSTSRFQTKFRKRLEMVPGVEPKQCQSGTKIVPFWKKGSCFQPFFENSSPRGAILKNYATLAGRGSFISKHDY